MHVLFQRTTAPYLVLMLVLGWAATPPRNHDAYFEISKNMDVFSKVLKEVTLNYVDEVETNKFVRKGIDAMLGSLDPYTNFISASEIEDYRFLSTGEYGGIGARIAQRDTGFVITEPYQDKPADKAGLRAGDILIEIDGEDVTDGKFNVGDISQMLRGEAKKPVKVKVLRYGEPAPLTLTIVRDKVKIDNVPYYGMVNDSIGYIALEGFTQNASGEVKDAYNTLKKNHPQFIRLVLDLRGNPGGLLYEAINISNLFINKGEKVVETRGRMPGSVKVYNAPNVPIDTKMPIAVLINGRSASASEIVSGVIQDLDRGVVVGRRSFGKGLVQTTRPLSYNNQIKITTARYYTPSGRNIQAIDYRKRTLEGSVLRIPDSLSHIFETRRGRPVKDAGGITPDVYVKEKELHKITQDLLREFLIFDFATQFRALHASIPPAREFKISDDLYKEFVAFTKQRGFTYTSDAEDDMAAFREILQQEAYYDDLVPALDRLEAEIKDHLQNDIFAHQDQIKTYLRAEIISRYYYAHGRVEASFRDDGDIATAVEVLQDFQRYDGIFNDKTLHPYPGDLDGAEAVLTDEDLDPEAVDGE